jgi:hypothetical protein
MMKRFLFLALSLPLLSIASIAQTPNASISPTANPTNNQAKSPPSPSPTQSKGEVTVVKLGPNGLEVSTPSTNPWVIYGTVGFALVGAVVLVIVVRRRIRKSAGFYPYVIVILIALLPITMLVFYLIGNWRGREDTVSQVQQYVGSNRVTMPQDQLPQPAASAAPLSSPAPSPQNNDSSSTASATPIYAHPAGFILLIGPELIVLTFIVLWWFRGFGFRYRPYFMDIDHRLRAIESEASRIPYRVEEQFRNLQSEIRAMKRRLPDDLEERLDKLEGPG